MWRIVDTVWERKWIPVGTPEWAALQLAQRTKKPLKETREEEEQFHSGQLFPETHSLSWEHTVPQNKKFSSVVYAYLWLGSTGSNLSWDVKTSVFLATSSSSAWCGVFRPAESHSPISRSWVFSGPPPSGTDLKHLTTEASRWYPEYYPATLADFS